MKIRNGFVSNSSSSSFIVAFKQDPQSKEELKELMFGDLDKHSGYTTQEIAECVWGDIQKQRGINVLSTIPDIVKTCIEVGGDIELIMDKFYPGLEEKSSEEYWNVRECLESMEKDEFREFIKEHQGVPMYKFKYSDEDGNFWGTMEHSGIFNKLPHERVSHH